MPSFPATGGAPRRSRVWRATALTAALLLGIWCYAPALHAYFAQDDFTLLALVRLLHEPWRVFVQDHFPGSLFFRPLGVFLWWLTRVWFDNAPRGHYAVNLALHLGCVAALYTLLQHLRRHGPLNALWAAAYAVHPLAIGTALWLSDRFDLIATAFSLLAFVAALDYVERPRAGALVAMLGWLLLAFMGKEIAIVGALAAAALIALPNGPTPLTRRQRWPATAAVLALVAAWLAYRHALMTNPQNLLLNPETLVGVFVKGTGLWARIGVEYLALDPRIGTGTRLALAGGAVLLVVAIGAGGRRPAHSPRVYGLVAALLFLVFLPGPTQAPVVAISANDLGPGTFWFDLISQSRLYHLSLAGLVAGLMLLTTPSGPAALASAGARHATLLACAALGVLIAAWAPASHRLAHDYARRTREQVAPLAAADAAIAQLPLPARACQIYLLDAASLWNMSDFADELIKASAAAPQRLAHCLIVPATRRFPGSCSTASKPRTWISIRISMRGRSPARSFSNTATARSST